MYCGKCKIEIDHLLDDDGIDYIKPCPNCIKKVYKILIERYIRKNLHARYTVQAELNCHGNAYPDCR